MAAFLLPLLGAAASTAFNLIQKGRHSSENSVKAQKLRLKAAGFSPNALFHGVGQQEVAIPTEAEPGFGISGMYDEIQSGKLSDTNNKLGITELDWRNTIQDEIATDQYGNEYAKSTGKTNYQQQRDTELRRDQTTFDREFFETKLRKRYGVRLTEAELDKLEQAAEQIRAATSLAEAQTIWKQLETTELKGMYDRLGKDGNSSLAKFIFQMIRTIKN